MNDSENLRYEFDQYCLDAAKRLLLRSGEPVPLQAKAFDTLLALVENRDRVVEKDELIKKVWPDTFVEEINLTVNISALRKSLGESPNEHRYIVTAPRRGYRFVAEVREIKNGEAPTPGVTPSAQNGRPNEPRNPRFNSRRAALAAAFLVIALLALSGFFLFSRQSKPEMAIRTIAVLPFNELGAGEEDHLGIGMADALITRLGAIRQIIVRPTSAILKYQATPADPLAAGRELGVEAALDGRVQRAGDRIRVTVQLFRVKDGVSLWSGTFDEDFTNILSVQDAISNRVAGALAVKLTSEEKESLVKHHTTNPQAYQAYVKGRYFLTLRTEHGFRKAIESFEQAVTSDPGYALAYAAMAEAWTLLGYYNFSSPAESFVKAQTSAIEALGIDGNLGDAQLALATIKVFYEWDFAGAEQAFLRARALKPNYDRLHWRYSIYLLAMRRFDEALAEIKRFREQDPLKLSLPVLEGDILRYARRDDQAMAKYREALELDPNSFLAHAQLAETYEQQGKYEEAMAEHEKALALSGDTPQMISEYRRVFQQSGIRGYWKKKVDLLTKATAGRPNAYEIVATYIKLGEKEQAFAWLEKMYQERQPVLIYLNVDPIYDGLRAEPRFIALVKRVGLSSRAHENENRLPERTG